MKRNDQGYKFQLNCTMDVWTLGMIILHCTCLSYKQNDFETGTFEEILSLYQQSKGQSLIYFEDKATPEEIEEQVIKEEKCYSGHSQSEEDFEERPQKKDGSWIDLFSKNQQNNDS